MKNSDLVYSTDPNREPCPNCGKYGCECETESETPLAGQTAALKIERKGRKGKSVTLVEDLQSNSFQLAELGKALKQYCGTGGTVKNGRIEIQGEHREKIAKKLDEMGIKSKRVGG